MKLFLISQSENNDYDTYDSAVVCAEDEEAARNIHPGGYAVWSDGLYGWCEKPESVSVECIGEAEPGLQPGVICASFNSG